MTKEYIPFSKRYGHVKISDKVQILNMNNDLRNALWNAIYCFILNLGGDIYNQDMKNFILVYYISFLNAPLDNRPSVSQREQLFRNVIMSEQWYRVYDFLEFIHLHKDKLKHTQSDLDRFEEYINLVLQRHNSGYRFVDGLISPITNQQEIDTVEEAINQSPYDGIKMHLHSALEKLSDKEDPDYRNSIKESISAVEVYVRKITGESTLGKAIDKLETNGVKIPQMLNVAIEKLYVFTNDSDGVRHALMDEPDTSKEEAYFMLIACSSLVNYLKAKEAKIKEKKDAE